ncbi:hypothetical protein N836_04715 [Leptolyngbya sp. Heron Island J]|nr:hypothetical protein N836_04715 [Leptolyngbya sp. Heron Island J]
MDLIAAQNLHCGWILSAIVEPTTTLLFNKLLTHYPATVAS